MHHINPLLNAKICTLICYFIFVYTSDVKEKLVQKLVLNKSKHFVQISQSVAAMHCW